MGTVRHSCLCSEGSKCRRLCVAPLLSPLLVLSTFNSFSASADKTKNNVSRTVGSPSLNCRTRNQRQANYSCVIIENLITDEPRLHLGAKSTTDSRHQPLGSLPHSRCPCAFLCKIPLTLYIMLETISLRKDRRQQQTTRYYGTREQINKNENRESCETLSLSPAKR